MSDFPCVVSSCMGRVIPTTGGGRYRQGKPIPADFVLYTCDTCGEFYLNEEDYGRLDKAQQRS